MAWAGADSKAPDYRTATASLDSVDQLLTLTGTVSRVSRAAASFGVAGTVTDVKVTEGQKVAAGDILAHLDTTDLAAAVNAAKATLAKAKATLETDQAAADSASDTESTDDAEVTVAAFSPGPSGGSGTSSAGGSRGEQGGSSPQVDLTKEVRAVNAAQAGAAKALAATAKALQAQTA